MTQSKWIQVRVTEAEKATIERNAALYASANGIKLSTAEAVRHAFLNMDVAALMTQLGKAVNADKRCKV